METDKWRSFTVGQGSTMHFVMIAQDNLNLIIDTIFGFMIRFYESYPETSILDKRGSYEFGGIKFRMV